MSSTGGRAGAEAASSVEDKDVVGLSSMDGGVNRPSPKVEHGVHAGENSGVTQEALIKYVLESALENIIHDVVLETHRKEKTARMMCAAIELEQIAGKASGSDEGKEGTQRFETDAAVMEDGRVYIKGNPLETVQEILCPTCKKPRLLYPIMGAGAREPIPGKEYCKRQPPIDMPGHDIYGIPFANSGRGKPKMKVNESISSQQEGNGNSASTPNSTPPPVSQEKERKMKAPAIPNINCDNCGQKVAITRFAQHLSKCMGISGRASSRSAMVKMNSQSDSRSRTSTPGPGFISSQDNTKKRKGSNEVEEGESPISKKRKYTKKSGLLKGSTGMSRSASQQSSLSFVDNANDDENEISLGQSSKPSLPSTLGSINASLDGASTGDAKPRPKVLSSERIEDEDDAEDDIKWSQDIFDDDDMFKKASFPGTGQTLASTNKRQRDEEEEAGIDSAPKKKVKKEKRDGISKTINKTSMSPVKGTQTSKSKRNGIPASTTGEAAKAPQTKAQKSEARKALSTGNESPSKQNSTPGITAPPKPSSAVKSGSKRPPLSGSPTKPSANGTPEKKLQSSGANGVEKQNKLKLQQAPKLETTPS